MNDADRIRALRDEGRIDDAQAERLLQALGAIAAERDGRADETSAADGSPDVDRWARIDLFACTLEVRVDAALDAPVAEAVRGEVRVEPHDGGWRVMQPRQAEGSWLDRLVDGVQRTRLDLRLPPRTGIDLDVKAGDVELHGVPALRGRLMAGDLDADGLRAVDVAVNAGDVELDLDPVPGLHRVRLSVGDLDVTMPDGADVRVEGHVSIGDAGASPPFSTERNGVVAETIAGVMGEGRATLRIDVGTGDLNIGVRRHGL